MIPYTNNTLPQVHSHTSHLYESNTNDNNYRSHRSDGNQASGFVQPVLPGYSVSSVSQPFTNYPSNSQLSNGHSYDSQRPRLPAQTTNGNRYTFQSSNENRYTSQPSNGLGSHRPSTIDIAHQYSSFPGVHQQNNYNSNPSVNHTHPLQVFTATSENQGWAHGNQQPEHLTQQTAQYLFNASPERTPTTNSRNISRSNEAFQENKDGLSLLYEDLDDEHNDVNSVAGNKQQLGHFIEKVGILVAHLHVFPLRRIEGKAYNC